MLSRMESLFSRTVIIEPRHASRKESVDQLAGSRGSKLSTSPSSRMPANP